MNKSVCRRSRHLIRKVKRLSVYVLTFLIFSFGISGEVLANFTPGNLVIYRVGAGGVDPLINTGNPVFLDEYTTAGTYTLNTVNLPTTASGANNALISDGTAIDEGELTLSTDGGYLVLSGYGSTIPAGVPLSTSTSALINRVVGTVDYTEVVNTTTSLTDWGNLGTPRSAVSVDGSAFWLGSDVDGVRYTTLGSTTTTSISTTNTDINQVNIFGGQLMASSATGLIRLGTVGSGLPITGPQILANLPGFPVTGSHFSYITFDLNAGVVGEDTMYVTDDVAGLIYKYSLVAGTWTSNGSVIAPFVRGITGSESGGVVSLFATSDDGIGTSNLYSLSDASGYNGPFTSAVSTIATAAANTAFRGVAFAPLAPNQPPVNSVPAAQITNEDTNITFSLGNGNLISISDPDAGSADVEVTLSMTNGTISLNGTVGLTFSVGDGVSDASMTFTGTMAAINTALNGLIYAPTAEYNGADTITLITNDLGNTGSGGALSDTDNIGITINAVNDPPTAVADAYSTSEDVQLVVAAAGVLSNDIDVDGPSLTVISGTAPTNGSLTLNSDGSFTYTPLPNFAGVDSFTYTMSDGTTNSSNTVTITVTDVNDAPIVTVPGGQATAIDVPITLSTGNGNLVSFSDIDVAAGSMTVTLTATNGTYTLASFAGLVFGVGDGTNDATTTFSGTLANVNLALDGIVFTPTASFTGIANIVVSANDNGNTGVGGALSDTEVVTITVSALTDTPTPTPTGVTDTPTPTGPTSTPTESPTITPTSTNTPTPTVVVNDPVVLKTVNISTPVVGQQVVFTLTASNPLTNGTATGVVVVDPIPSYFTPQSATTTLGTSSISGNTVTFNIGILTAGQTATMTITALVINGASQSTTNTATITGTDTSGAFSQSGSVSMSIGGVNPPATCDLAAPGNAPDLFQIDTTYNTATLHFSPAGNPVTYHYVAYGYTPDAQGFSLEIAEGQSSGAMTYLIGALNPGTVYYFKVRGGNGCKTGSWSNIMSVQTPDSRNNTYKFDKYGNLIGSSGSGGGLGGSTLKPGLVPSGFDLKIPLVFGTLVILIVVSVLFVKDEKR